MKSLIIDAKHFPIKAFHALGIENHGKKQKKLYYNCISAFDIETSTIDVDGYGKQAFMYVWQWAFDIQGTCYCVLGRTWDEFLNFASALADSIPKGVRLVVFDHNLSYEFQYLAGIYSFKPEDVFCMDSRKVLTALMFDALEFRCSYIHSNMSLAEYTNKMNVEHKKLSGDEFDYSKVRYPWTELTEQEKAYCVHDVIGLVEAVETDMAIYHDNIKSFPLTSTGYVRRDARLAMESEKWVHDIMPDYETYRMLRKAFRGGNTHANRWFSNVVLHNVTSYDRSSSYPDVQVNCEYPMSKFFHEGPITVERLTELMETRHRAVLMSIALSDVRLTDNHWGFPYIPRDKCQVLKDAVLDNGRVVSASYLEMCITDVDFRIILSEYTFDDIVITDCYHARYGKQPKPLIDCTIQYYKDKTQLKGVKGQEVYYMKQKNKLNSIYGMEATDPCKLTIQFENGEYLIDESKTPEQTLKDNEKQGFLSYAWGVWVTAWARYRLEEGLRLVYSQGASPIYTDTDSVKYIGKADWSAYNEERKQDSIRSGAYADDPKGNRHYMGVFELDAEYTDFKTMGAKKYVFTENGSDTLECTIAGVGKKKGGAELGSIENFKEGFIFTEAGGTESRYNDDIDLTIEREGHSLRITRNVCILPSTYELGLTGEYKRLLSCCASALNNPLKDFEEILAGNR